MAFGNERYGMNLDKLRIGRLQPGQIRQWLITLFVGVALSTSLVNLQAAPAFTGCGGELVTAQNAQAEAQVVELVNAERAKVGLPPLKAVGALAEAARYHSADMAADRYRDHYTYDRDDSDTLVRICTWTERVSQYYPGFDRFTENVGNGTSSPQTIMTAWMNSTGHKANILGDFREIGVGYHALYWTQDFTTQYTVYPIIIEREARQTTAPAVSLYLYGNWTEVRLRNDAGAWSAWQPFQNELSWTLANEAGTRTVDVEMRSGQTTVSSSDTIELVLTNQTATAISSATATHTPTSTTMPTLTSTTMPTPTSTATTILTGTATPTATMTPTDTPTATTTSTPTATPVPTLTVLPPTPQAVATATPNNALYLPVVRR